MMLLKEAQNSLKDDIGRKCVAFGERSFVGGAPKVDASSQVIETLSIALIDSLANKEEVIALKDETEDSFKDDIGRTCVAFGECAFVGDTHNADVAGQGVETVPVALINGVINKEGVTALKDEAKDSIEEKKLAGTLLLLESVLLLKMLMWVFNSGYRDFVGGTE
ncbi:hypothetical protein O6H91_12G060500 [Diphasiastrum complanatum]|uniref:Uncharacterized protein n=1 Tax=Diphasiastrum complanatum TaxID=34168 RepID=A0ACC2C2J1_DIPCM|nr:hypothetical protein O6H91_12G060500 [Diphasiastrum complanatum]